jgi:hypothetical protein
LFDSILLQWKERKDAAVFLGPRNLAKRIPFCSQKKEVKNVLRVLAVTLLCFRPKGRLCYLEERQI